jgi:ketosteroid isomerase-like protein
MRARSPVTGARLVKSRYAPAGSDGGTRYCPLVARESVQVVEDLIDAWNRRDLAAALALLHPECELHPVEAINPVRGHEEFAAGFNQWFEAFDAFSADPEDFVARGDRVLVPVMQRARGKGSGVEIEQRFYQLFTLRDGKVLRFEEFADEAEARRAFED